MRPVNFLFYFFYSARAENLGSEIDEKLLNMSLAVMGKIRIANDRSVDTYNILYRTERYANTHDHGPNNQVDYRKCVKFGKQYYKNIAYFV